MSFVDRLIEKLPSMCTDGNSNSYNFSDGVVDLHLNVHDYYNQNETARPISGGDTRSHMGVDVFLYIDGFSVTNKLTDAEIERISMVGLDLIEDRVKLIMENWK